MATEAHHDAAGSSGAETSNYSETKVCSRRKIDGDDVAGTAGISMSGRTFQNGRGRMRAQKVLGGADRCKSNATGTDPQ